jgi:hypothetical protein
MASILDWGHGPVGEMEDKDVIGEAVTKATEARTRVSHFMTLVVIGIDSR